MYEMLDTMAWFASTWAAPPDTGLLWAAGTQASCSWQGFFLHQVIGGPLSNCSMAFYFYMVVFHQKTSKELERWERFVLPTIFCYAMGSATLLLVMDQYNPIGAVCYAQGVPPLCGNSVYTPHPDVPCERGDWAWVYGMVFFYLPLWSCYMGIFYFNIMIYWQLRSTPEGSWFGSQSFYYGLAFCITWAPSTLWSALQWKDGGSFWLDLASTIFEPLGGFWNLLIFLSNRPKTRRELKEMLCHCSCLFGNTTTSDNTRQKQEERDKDDVGQGGGEYEDDDMMSDEPGSHRGVKTSARTKSTFGSSESTSSSSHSIANSKKSLPPPESAIAVADTTTRHVSNEEQRHPSATSITIPAATPATNSKTTPLEQSYFSAAAEAAIANPIGQTILTGGNDSGTTMLVPVDGRPRRAHYHNKNRSSTLSSATGGAAQNAVQAVVLSEQAPTTISSSSLPPLVSSKNPRYEVTERMYNNSTNDFS
ncbi:hypothetical protein ACA910_011174 [Epithemia clementina (nom. ined.)]